MVDKTTTILDKITKWSIYGLAFLLPLWFLPFTPANVLDFPKQLLLVILTIVAAVSFVIKALVEGKLEIKKSFLNFIILGLVLIFAASTAFSWAPGRSFFGSLGQVSAGFLNLLCLALLLMVAVNSFDSGKSVLRLVEVGLGGAVLVILLGVVQAWGKFVLPWGFTKSNAFNTIGSVNALGIFAGAVLSLVLALLVKEKNATKKVLLGGLGLLSLVAVIAANNWIVWSCLGIGMIGLVVFMSVGLKIQRGWIAIPIILLALSLVLALIQPNLPGIPRGSVEVSPSYQASFDIGRKIVSGQQGWLRSLIGTGPGSFAFLHSLYKSQALNRTIFWGVRFQSAPSQMLEVMGTVGILGVLAMLALIVGFGILAIKNLVQWSKSEKTGRPALMLGLFSAWLVLAAGKFLYGANLSLEFMFWLMMAAFLAISLKERIKLH